MQALVVVAHPHRASFCHAAADAAANGLRRGGHTVDTLDLYAVGFRAAMSAAERAAYHGDRPVLDPQVADGIERLRAAQVLVFVYPTWWSGLPAILKGWLERTMVPGVGFVFNERHQVRPGLTHVRRIVGISTYGSPRAYVAAINDNGRRTICRALRMSTGIGARTTWLGLYALDKRSDQDRRAFLRRIDERMARL